MHHNLDLALLVLLVGLLVVHHLLIHVVGPLVVHIHLGLSDHGLSDHHVGPPVVHRPLEAIVGPLVVHHPLGTSVVDHFIHNNILH